MYRIAVLFSLLLSLLALGCRKPEELPTYYVSEEIKRYCWFPDGSYWIYELEGSVGIFDTVTYTGTSSNVVSDGIFEYQQEILGIHLTVAGRVSRHSISVLVLDGERNHLSHELIESYNTPSTEQYDYLLFEDSDGANTLGLYPNPTRFFHDSIQVRGITYTSAIEVSVNPPQAADWTHNIVWVRDVGIVRRSMKDGTIWDLVRHHINN